MLKNLLKSLVIVFTAGLTMAWVTIAHAQLMVEEGKISENVRPGDTLDKKLTLFNTGEQPLRVRVTWEDFEYIEPFNGKKKFSAAGTGTRSILQWVKFSPQEFSLVPFGRQVVNCTIKIPDDAKGGYYGVLFFEQLPEGADNFTGVKVITRVGTLFFIETLTKTKKAMVENIRIEGETLRGQVVNQGDTISIPHGIYYFLDQKGVAALRGELERFYIPPTKTAEFQIPLKAPALIAGSYTMVLTFDLDEGDSVVRELDLKKDDRGWQIEHVRE